FLHKYGARTESQCRGRHTLLCCPLIYLSLHAFTTSKPDRRRIALQKPLHKKPFVDTLYRITIHTVYTEWRNAGEVLTIFARCKGSPFGSANAVSGWLRPADR